MDRRLWVTFMLAFGGPLACTSLLGDFSTGGALEGEPSEGGADASMDRSTDRSTTKDAPHLDAPRKDTAVEDSPSDDSPADDSPAEDATTDSPPEEASTDAPVEAKISVILAGTGTGTVKSAAAGITCPGTCSAEVDATGVYTLIATPSPGSLFAGWKGACKGTGNCTVIPPADVTATFAVPATWDPNWSLASTTDYTDGDLAVALDPSATATAEIRTTFGKSTGAYYWEIKATGGDGSTDWGGIGIIGSDMPNNAEYIGDVASGFSFGYDDEFYFNWSGTTVICGGPGACSGGSTPISAGTVYMFALDLDHGNFWAGQDGVWFESGTPAYDQTVAAKATVAGISGTVYPAATLYAPGACCGPAVGPNIDALTANFGGSAFSYVVPTGFTPGFY